MIKMVSIVILLFISACSEFYTTGVSRESADEYKITELDTLYNDTLYQDTLHNDTSLVIDPGSTIGEDELLDTILDETYIVPEGWSADIEITAIDTPVTLYGAMTSNVPLIGEYVVGTNLESIGVNDSTSGNITLSYFTKKLTEATVTSFSSLGNSDDVELQCFYVVKRKISGTSPGIHSELSKQILFSAVSNISAGEAVWIDNLNLSAGDSLTGSLTGEELDYYLVPEADKFLYDIITPLYQKSSDGETLNFKAESSMDLVLIVENNAGSVNSPSASSLKIIRPL